MVECIVSPERIWLMASWGVTSLWAYFSLQFMAASLLNCCA